MSVGDNRETVAALQQDIAELLELLTREDEFIEAEIAELNLLLIVIK